MRNDAEQNSADQSSVHQRPSRRAVFVLFSSLLAIAAGLYTWNGYLRSVRYEVALDPPQLFTGAPDTLHLVCYGVGRAGARVPFSHPEIRGEILEGARLGTLERDGRDLRFISHGELDGQVQLRVSVAEWPFPLLVSFDITAPVARIGSLDIDDPTQEAILGTRHLYPNTDTRSPA